MLSGVIYLTLPSTAEFGKEGATKLQV